MEDILTPLYDKTIKWSFVLFVVFLLLGIFFFAALANAGLTAANRNGFTIAGVVCTALAVLFGAMSFVRFLRRRSITAGLFLTTTAATLVYAISSRIVAANTAVVNPYAAQAGIATYAGGAGAGGVFTPITLMQIGLFALWFLFILFTIYVYIRPIRRIDKLLTQIIEGKEVKKLRVGKLSEYSSIEAKLRTLAEEKRKREVQRQGRLEKSRVRAGEQKKLMQELLAEKEKLSPAPDVKQ